MWKDNSLSIFILFTYCLLCLHVYLYTSLLTHNYLFLALAPEITDPPRDVSTVDGKTVVLTCRVFGAPKPQVKWIRAGVELTGGRYTVMENGDLQIRYVSFIVVL
jgi:hypothetical protein